eukprot:gene42028-56900_t
MDKTHASLIARVRHMGLSYYTVRFTDFDAAYVYDPEAPAASKVTATFQTASLDTGNAKFDGDFADKFLDADANPTITFVSTAITPGEGNIGTMTGDLTCSVKGVENIATSIRRCSSAACWLGNGISTSFTSLFGSSFSRNSTIRSAASELVPKPLRAIVFPRRSFGELIPDDLSAAQKLLAL